MLVTMTTVSFYMITAYTPTFGNRVLHLADSQTLLVTLCVGISNFIWLPLMGALSDRVGRTPLLITFTMLALATAYPALSWLVSSPSFGHLLTVELWLSFLYGSYNGAMVVFLTELMPREVRAPDLPRLQLRHRDFRRLHSHDLHLVDPGNQKPGDPRRVAFHGRRHRLDRRVDHARNVEKDYRIDSLPDAIAETV